MDTQQELRGGTQTILSQNLTNSSLHLIHFLLYYL